MTEETPCWENSLSNGSLFASAKNYLFWPSYKQIILTSNITFIHTCHTAHYACIDCTQIQVKNGYKTWWNWSHLQDSIFVITQGIEFPTRCKYIYKIKHFTFQPKLVIAQHKTILTIDTVFIASESLRINFNHYSWVTNV